MHREGLLRQYVSVRVFKCGHNGQWHRESVCSEKMIHQKLLCVASLVNIEVLRIFPFVYIEKVNMLICKRPHEVLA